MNQPPYFVKFSPPLIGEEEINEVVDTLRSDWITAGPKTRQFEEDFAQYLHSPAALALNSCTAGLHVALLAAEIGPGDEVITTPMTFVASVNVIEHVGATPILVDVEPETLNIDAARIEAAITPRTKAILPVHFAGHPVELDAIHDIAARHRLLVIEDAAHAVPAAYRGRPIGSSDNPVAFSFYATKNLTTGEGGMLTGDPEFLAKARILGLHGLSREAWNRYEKGGSWRYDVGLPGFKYNMTDIQASLGIWQLRKLDQFQKRRTDIVTRYHHAWGPCGSFQLPTERDHVKHAWHLYVLRLQQNRLAIDRDQFLVELNARGVGTSVHFIPIPHHSFYRKKYGFRSGQFPVAESNFERALSLPLNPRMSDRDVQHVIDTVLEVQQKFQVRRMAA